jgi:TonB family protein
LPETPTLAADALTPLTRERSVEPAAIALDASAASLPMQGVEAPDLPRTIFSPAPVYPPALLAARIEGVVKLRVEVDAQGRVASARVLVSSGRPEFDAAAKEAVLQWRFAPSDPQQTAPRALAVPIRFGILAE